MDELLKKLGCRDIDTTKARFLNDMDFYLEVAREMLGDPGFDELGVQLEKHDAKSAFDAAHALKGITGNCGVSPLYDIVVQIVELLRSGAPDYKALAGLYKKLQDKRAEAEEVLKGVSRLD